MKATRKFFSTKRTRAYCPPTSYIYLPMNVYIYLTPSSHAVYAKFLPRISLPVTHALAHLDPLSLRFFPPFSRKTPRCVAEAPWVTMPALAMRALFYSFGPGRAALEGWNAWCGIFSTDSTMTPKGAVMVLFLRCFCCVWEGGLGRSGCCLGVMCDGWVSACWVVRWR